MYIHKKIDNQYKGEQLTSALYTAIQDFVIGLKCCNGPPLNPTIRSSCSVLLVHLLTS